MVAINSDVEFTSWPAQLDLIEIAGRHGLEIGFSYWCFGDPQVTWRLFEDDDTPSAQAEAAMALARAGILDTLHSFGGVIEGRGVAFDRLRIARALAYLRDAGVRTRVYSNHGGVHDIQNVGGDWASYQQGDLPESRAYHLDLTQDFGVRFFWTDIDSELERSFFSIAPDAANPLLVPQTARDGRRMLRFRRFRGPLNRAPHAGSLAAQFELILSQAIDGYSVVYQHLGVHRDGDGPPRSVTPPYFDAAGADVFRQLARLQANGDLLITTTERLLMHAVLMQARPWTMSRANSTLLVDFARNLQHCGIPFQLERRDLQGWTVPLDGFDRVFATFDGERWELPIYRDGSRRYAGIPWVRMSMLDALETAKAIEGTRVSSGCVAE